MLGRVGFCGLLAGLATALVSGSVSLAASRPQVLFDDFTYCGFNQSFELWHHGWRVRTVQGWPGIAGAAWSQAGISFVRDPAGHGNRLLRLTSTTDGTPAGISQAQICQRRKFFEGTYATRVRADGDQLVETFYVISPLQAPPQDVSGTRFRT